MKKTFWLGMTAAVLMGTMSLHAQAAGAKNHENLMDGAQYSNPAPAADAVSAQAPVVKVYKPGEYGAAAPAPASAPAQAPQAAPAPSSTSLPAVSTPPSE